MTDTTAITPAQVAEILIGGERDRREVPQISESNGDLDQASACRRLVDRRRAGRHRDVRPATGSTGLQQGLGGTVRRPPTRPIGDPVGRVRADGENPRIMIEVTAYRG